MTLTRAKKQTFPFLPQVLSGETADVYFLRTRQVLQDLGVDPKVGFEIFAGRPGILCGVGQVIQLLTDAGFGGEIWTIREGEEIQAGESAIEIYGPYNSFGVYETAILGILASCTGWATAARDVVEASAGVPVISFGARHCHPNVAGIMDFAAVVGGCLSCSTPLGAALANRAPSGTMSHAYILIVGDTVRAAEDFNDACRPKSPASSWSTPSRIRPSRVFGWRRRWETR